MVRLKRCLSNYREHGQSSHAVTPASTHSFCLPPFSFSLPLCFRRLPFLGRPPTSAYQPEHPLCDWNTAPDLPLQWRCGWQQPTFSKEKARPRSGCLLDSPCPAPSPLLCRHCERQRLKEEGEERKAARAGVAWWQQGGRYGGLLWWARPTKFISPSMFSLFSISFSPFTEDGSGRPWCRRLRGVKLETRRQALEGVAGWRRSRASRRP
jgi:hypothetical protein